MIANRKGLKPRLIRPAPTQKRAGLLDLHSHRIVGIALCPDEPDNVQIEPERPDVFLEPLHHQHELIQKCLLVEILSFDVFGRVVGDDFHVIGHHQTKKSAQKIEDLFKKPDVGFFGARAGKIPVRIEPPGPHHLFLGLDLVHVIGRTGDHGKHLFVCQGIIKW